MTSRRDLEMYRKVFMSKPRIPRGDWETLRDAAAIIRRESTKPRGMGVRVLSKVLTDLAAKLEERGATCGGYKLGCIPWTNENDSGVVHNPHCPMSWEYRP